MQKLTKSAPSYSVLCIRNFVIFVARLNEQNAAKWPAKMAREARHFVDEAILQHSASFWSRDEIDETSSIRFCQILRYKEWPAKGGAKRPPLLMRHFLFVFASFCSLLQKHDPVILYMLHVFCEIFFASSGDSGKLCNVLGCWAPGTGRARNIL